MSEPVEVITENKAPCYQMQLQGGFICGMLSGVAVSMIVACLLKSWKPLKR